MTTFLTEIEKGSGLAAELEANIDKLLTCVHCGLCLPACPTYRVLGNENDSPRGRIYLMRAVTEGRLSIGSSFVSHIDRCLGCRACESVCPSGVPYGQLLEAARVEVKNARSDEGDATATLFRFLLNHVFTRPLLLRAGFAIARWLRDSGLARLAYESNTFGEKINLALALLIATSRRKRKDDFQPGSEVKRPPANRVSVAVLRGCVMEGLFKETNRATERVLIHAGCEVLGADAQVCCGALHSHAGEIERARELARRNIDAFSASGCEVVIVNSAGCGAAMKEYDALLAGDPKYALRAREFSQKVRDVSEFLAARGIKGLMRAIPRKVAYDAPCHLLHAQKVAAAPVELLNSIPGLELVPLQGSANCCGGAGTYNLQQPRLSAEILTAKIENIRMSGADAVATGNPGCIMQIGAGIMKAGLEIEVVHPIELLDDALPGW